MELNKMGSQPLSRVSGVKGPWPDYSAPENTLESLLYAAKVNNLRVYTSCFSRDYDQGWPKIEKELSPDWAKASLAVLNEQLFRGDKITLGKTTYTSPTGKGYYLYENGHNTYTELDFLLQGDRWLIARSKSPF